MLKKVIVSNFVWAYQMDPQLPAGVILEYTDPSGQKFQVAPTDWLVKFGTSQVVHLSDTDFNAIFEDYVQP